MRRLAICADDYGLSAGVDDAIAELIAAGRLSALSCLVDGPRFAAGAARLDDLGTRADVGLHLNFTESFGERAPRFPLSGLIARAYARLLDAGAIRTEIRRQLDAFEDGCGFAPHHVDGHQHVQQLPMIRDALLEELERRSPAQRPWLRSGMPPASGIGSLAADRRKPAILGLLGARTFV
ncbi:MAG TPA: ChbG/HpnK family deacetylase, partial [Ramlibacter sp.]|nr:ChbG/HpnK family deacetylase [Ramlibacter sp.]